MQAPPDLEKTALQVSRTAGFGLKFRGIRGREISDLVAFATGSLGEFLDRSLDSPHLKSLILRTASTASTAGPMTRARCSDCCSTCSAAARKPSRVSSATSWAAWARSRRRWPRPAWPRASNCAPPRRRSSARSERPRRGRHARGRQRLDADLVVSNADPRRTFLELVPAAELDAGISRGRARHQDGWAMRQAQPRADRGAESSRRRSRRRRTAQRAVHARALARGAQRRLRRVRGSGRIAEGLWIDCLVPSLLDPSLVTEAGT